MSLKSSLFTLLAIAVFGTLLAVGDGSRVTAADDILDMPAEFAVMNSNTSGMQVRCAGDDAPYKVRGHIVGPRAAIESPAPAITQYIYGFDTGWHHPFSIEGYDWGAELAKLGHVSLMIDMLGYDTSDHPPGNLMCLGTQADVSHQITQQLRSGQYSLSGGTNNGIAFSKVLLAGHDIAGGMAEIEAYSYKDIDGLIIMSWTDQGVNFPYLFECCAIRANQLCMAGGEHYETGAPGGQYHYFAPQPNERYKEDLFYDADPTVLNEVVALRNRNPCGYVGSIIPAMELDTVRNSEITVPVFILQTRDDPVFTPAGKALQPALFVNSPDVASEEQTAAGHFPWFEKNAREYRARISNWLCSRGFVSAGVNCSTPGKVTGGGQIDGTDPAFSPTGELLTLPAIVASASSSSGSQANFGFVAQFATGDAAPRGNLTYHDHGTGDVIKATDFDLLTITGTHAKFTGTGTVNDVGGQRIEVEVDDLSGADSFSIRILTDGGYENSGALIGGSIKIHR